MGYPFFMDDPCINFYQRYFDSDMIMYSNLFTFTCIDQNVCRKQTLNSQKTYHISYLRASYVMSIASI